MKQPQIKDYSGSYSAINAFHGFGILVIVAGVIVALIGAGGASASARYGGSGATAFAVIIGVLPGAGIIVAGIFNLVFAKMAEASVHTAEMTQQLLLIAIRKNDDDAPASAPKPSERAIGGVGGASKHVPSSPAPAPAKKEPEPKKPRPLGGDNPDLEEGDVVETYRGVKIYKRTTGIFIGSQWYPGIPAAKAAIDEHKDPDAEI